MCYGRLPKNKWRQEHSLYRNTKHDYQSYILFASLIKKILNNITHFKAKPKEIYFYISSGVGGSSFYESGEIIVFYLFIMAYLLFHFLELVLAFT